MMRTHRLLAIAVVATVAPCALVQPAGAVTAAQVRKAAIISVAARNALDKGDYDVAAKLYDDAYSVDRGSRWAAGLPRATTARPMLPSANSVTARG